MHPAPAACAHEIPAHISMVMLLFSLYCGARQEDEGAEDHTHNHTFKTLAHTHCVASDAESELILSECCWGPPKLKRM